MVTPNPKSKVIPKTKHSPFKAGVKRPLSNTSDDESINDTQLDRTPKHDDKKLKVRHLFLFYGFVIPVKQFSK